MLEDNKILCKLGFPRSFVVETVASYSVEKFGLNFSVKVGQTQLDSIRLPRLVCIHMARLMAIGLFTRHFLLNSHVLRRFQWDNYETSS